MQATVAWMVDLRLRNMSFRFYERLLIAENKWRAVRYGLEGKLLDFGIEQALPAPDLIRELLGRVESYAPKLNIEDELAHVHTILSRGSNADQQLYYYHTHGNDPAAVVDFMVAETENLA
jgi:carboxylate-amine ligase